MNDDLKYFATTALCAGLAAAAIIPLGTAAYYVSKGVYELNQTRVYCTRYAHPLIFPARHIGCMNHVTQKKLGMK